MCGYKLKSIKGKNLDRIILSNAIDSTTDVVFANKVVIA